jgi:uncharacterized protein YfdQ (DUF2303 family)
VTDLRPVIDTARASTQPHPLDADGRFFLVVDADGTSCVIDLDAERDKHVDFPRRKEGTVNVHDAASFKEYFLKHGSSTSEIYADPTRHGLVAVLDAHTTSEARWQRHRLNLVFVKTPQWLAWEKRNSVIGTQVAFAEHVEDRLPDFVDPDSATMLELAQTFQAKTQVTFEASRRLSSGERQLEYRENVAASAGRKGDIAIPATFTVGLVPFEASDPYSVTARLRYRITDGALTIGYVLDRPEDVLRAAFLGVVERLSTMLDRTIITGNPG